MAIQFLELDFNSQGEMDLGPLGFMQGSYISDSLSESGLLGFTLSKKKGNADAWNQSCLVPHLQENKNIGQGPGNRAYWWLSGKDSPCSAGDMGSRSGLERSSVEGNGNPVHYSCLGNPMDRGAWWATVHGVKRVRHDSVTKQ